MRFSSSRQEEVTIPEIPCSFDEPGQSSHDYHQCMVDAPGTLKRRGLVQPDQIDRTLDSSMRAWHEVN